MKTLVGYNGWKNYETWLVNVWLNNEEPSYYMLEELKAAPIGVAEKAERLEEAVRDMYWFEPYGIVADIVNMALGSVDWLAIIEAE